MEKLTVPAGTLIHIKGIPFELPASVEVLGTPANLALALRPDGVDCSDGPLMGYALKERLAQPASAATADGSPCPATALP